MGHSRRFKYAGAFCCATKATCEKLFLFLGVTDWLEDLHDDCFLLLMSHQQFFGVWSCLSGIFLLLLFMAASISVFSHDAFDLFLLVCDSLAESSVLVTIWLEDS